MMMHVAFSVFLTCLAVPFARQCMAGTPAEHRQVLAKLGRKHFVSQSGLAAVLKDLQEAGLLTDSIPSSRSSIKRSREDEFANETAYGHILRTMDIVTNDASGNASPHM
jgi:hypothetical protein